MDMRFLFWFLFLLHLSVSAEDKRPNIFSCCPTIRPCVLWVLRRAGRADAHLDRLGADGMIFDAHYDTAICMASRANVMTGMFEYKTGCNFEHGTMLEGIGGGVIRCCCGRWGIARPSRASSGSR